MIRFACKQCGISFDRPDEAAGTLVFCSCGAGNRVPWESTVPAPEAADGAADGPSVGRAIPLGEERGVPPVRRPDGSLAEQRRKQRDPDFCLNHPDAGSSATCPDCEAAFCASCLVTFRGEVLCGPCKNFRVRALQRPGEFSVAALFSLLLGLFTGPFGLFCVSLSASMHNAVPSFFALIMPVAAMLLGAKAMRDIETRPRMTGRSIAIAGLVSGLVTAFLTVVFAILVGKQVE
jgi:hypothetical protein